MAQDKIIDSILQSAREEAQQILSDAEKQASEEKKRINDQTEQKLKELEKQFQENSKELERRAKLNANLQERKDLLEIKQEVMQKAFNQAKIDISKLPQNEWKALIEKIVLAGTITDTEYLKVPEKDIFKYTKPISGNKTFLDQLNEALKENGHLKKLKLDKHPAAFNDGVMLIGKYSDINASFDVLIDNLRESIEWDVSKILFN